MSRIIFWVIAIYFIYNFVFRFLLPLLSAGSRIKTAMRDQMNGAQQPPQSTQQAASQQKSPEAEGEYIDFEEVK